MEENFIETWDKVLEAIKDEVSAIAFNTYIAVLVPRLVDKNKICLLSPSQYYSDIIRIRYLGLIENALKCLTSVNYEVTFESKDSVKEIEDNINEPKVIPGQISALSMPSTNSEYQTRELLDPKTAREKAGLNEKFTFSNFIVGTNNRFAQATAYSVYKDLGKTNPLYIYGGVGLGKTHLMQAIGNAVIDEDASKRVLYCTGELFVNELIKAMLNPNLNESFKEKYRNADLLLIDDVQFIAGKDKCQEEFFHTFNALVMNGKQVVLTSERPPKEINGFEDRLKTRFSEGVNVDIQTPDYETRYAIIKQKCEEERYIINDEYINKIATNAKTNVRVLLGIITQLIAYTKLTNEPINDAIVDKTIESTIVKNTNVLTSKLVMQVVAQFFNIKVTDLTSDKRSNTITRPRQIAMYLCREVADMSFPQIGKDFGGRDHSTVLHAYSKVKEEYDTNKDSRDLIDDIKKALERES